MVNEKIKYVVENVATQTEPVISNGKDNFTIHEALVKLLNNDEKILSLIATE